MTVIVKNGRVLLQSLCMQIRDLPAVADGYLALDIFKSRFVKMLREKRVH